MALGILIGIVQVAFAFACVFEVKRKGRLNNWWILAAALFGLPAYLVARQLAPKE